LLTTGYFQLKTAVKEMFMKIEVLGPGCAKCKKLYENTQNAVKELNVQAEIAKVEEIQKIINAGVMMTPALVIDGEVKSVGKVLSVVEIKKILN
jgi:small redox-active disulfide protein 2